MSIDDLTKAIEDKDYQGVEALCDSIKAEHGRLVVHIEPDYDMEDPCEEDGWQVYSFSRRHSNYKDPDELGFFPMDPEDMDPELQAKLDSGLAFVLSYFEHGNCVWSLQGTGPQCRFDNVGIAGLLIWESEEGDLGPKTLEERRKDAEGFMALFTQWCNGDAVCYYSEGDDLMSAGGFYETEHLVESLLEQLDEGHREVKFVSSVGLHSYVEEEWKKQTTKESVS